MVLTKTEFRVLSYLIRNIDQIVAVEDLWAYAWGPSKSLKRKSIQVFVSRVRRKLAPFGLRIDGVVGVGYIFSHGACCSVERVEGEAGAGSQSLRENVGTGLEP